jgi:hypothetical protein
MPRITINSYPVRPNGEKVFNFSDGTNGGLVSFRHDSQGQLIVEVYNHDAGVIVRGDTHENGA